jgi:hypothetical protein
MSGSRSSSEARRTCRSGRARRVRHRADASSKGTRRQGPSAATPRGLLARHVARVLGKACALPRETAVSPPRRTRAEPRAVGAIPLDLAPPPNLDHDESRRHVAWELRAIRAPVSANVRRCRAALSGGAERGAGRPANRHGERDSAGIGAMAPGGVEPPHADSKSAALSTELRGPRRV